MQEDNDECCGGCDNGKWTAIGWSVVAICVACVMIFGM
jgi:hypothetical protein